MRSWQALQASAQQGTEYQPKERLGIPGEVDDEGLSLRGFADVVKRVCQLPQPDLAAVRGLGH